MITVHAASRRVVTTWAFVALVSAADFDICLDRPEAIGRRSTVHGVGSSLQSVKITVDGAAQPNRDEHISIDVQAGVEVQAVGPTGKPTKIRLVITKAMAGPMALR